MNLNGSPKNFSWWCWIFVCVHFIVSIIGFSYVFVFWAPNHKCPVTTVEGEGGGETKLDVARRPRDIGAKMPCQPTPKETLRRIMGPAFNPRYMSIHKPETGEEGKQKNAEKNVQGDQYLKKRHKKRPEAFHVHSGFSRIIYDEPVVAPQQDNSLFPLAQKDGGREEKGNNNQNDEFTVKTSRKPAWRPPERVDGRKLDADFEQVEPVTMDEDTKVKASAPETFLKTVLPLSKAHRLRREATKGFPWVCESRVEWLDLGNNHFPRFLRSVVCTTAKCWFGHFHCRGKAFTVKILRRRKDSCVSDGGDVDNVANLLSDDVNSEVPEEFREQWVFEERAVTSCCECAS